MPKLKNFGLYFITDSTLTRKNVIEDATSAIKAGVKIIQYREKNSPTKKMLKEALQIKKLCSKNDVLFIINDRIDIALRVDADGVHLGEEDISYDYARKLLGKNKIIGLSAHSVKDALQNEKIGADNTSIGPIYHTSTKKNGHKPVGLDPIKQLKNKLKIPFVAIGGINKGNIDEVLEAGARNIAIISAIVSKGNVKNAAKYFIEKINSSK